MLNRSVVEKGKSFDSERYFIFQGGGKKEQNFYRKFPCRSFYKGSMKLKTLDWLQTVA
jgi:hypothetical protein